MTPTRPAAKDRVAVAAAAPQASPPQAQTPKLGPQRHRSLLGRHVLEVLAAMAVGMVATGASFRSIVGLKTWEQVTVQDPRRPWWRWLPG